MKSALEEARSAVMGPLSAASMESHSRAYPHLVKLHMLGEAADCAALLQEGSFGQGPLERQRRLRWDERLAATHPSLTTQVRLCHHSAATWLTQYIHFGTVASCEVSWR